MKLLSNISLRHGVAMLVAALCFLIGGILVGTKATTDYLLFEDATSTARNWARVLAETVTDLEQIAGGEEPTKASMTLFGWAQRAGQVFRYEIYNREGYSQTAPVQPAPVQTAPAAQIQPTPSVAAPPRADIAARPAPAADAAAIEVAFWNSIKDEKNPSLFEAYLKRYPNGAFADIARITLDELKAATRTPPAPHADDSVQIGDPILLSELRDRLYELNFDPGLLDGPLTDAARKAIQEFQQQINVPPTGIATMGLLRRLRELGGVKPWASIVYGKDSGKWGMAWNESTRKAAVASARASCGDSSACPVEVSFFGTACGVFAYSASSWAITARDDIGKAKAAALADCGKRGRSCQIAAAVCADGAERFTTK